MNPEAWNTPWVPRRELSPDVRNTPCGNDHKVGGMNRRIQGVCKYDTTVKDLETYGSERNNSMSIQKGEGKHFNASKALGPQGVRRGPCDTCDPLHFLRGWVRKTLLPCWGGQASQAGLGQEV